ncbi:MAG: VWA domain-containing protein [Solirubrobacterales bacterium]|nr:VWA domain-containing protein [Solirubrobacterales bacterium]
MPPPDRGRSAAAAKSAGKAIYGGIPDDPPGALDGQLLSFAEDLRTEGVAIGTSEILDAFQALNHVAWTDQEHFKEALAATLAKSNDDRRVFEIVFDRFFFRAAEAQATRKNITEAPGQGGEPPGDVNLDTLRQQIAAALRDGSDDALRDLARLAIAAFGRGEGSGVLGVDVQRIRRALGLRTEPQPDLPDSDPRHDGLPRDQLRKFEQHLRRELERGLIERTASLPPKRPLNELDRTLPTGPIQDLAAVHRVVAQLKRRLATQGHELKGRNRHAHVDFRRTMRASLQTGGVPIALKYRPRRPRRPEIFVLCDVSTSVTSASTFFLSVLHALHDNFRKLRSYVFIERISEVTEVFERERDFRAASEAISRDAGVADVSGYTDYGRVWLEFLNLIEDELHPRATVIVLGDARTNGRPPRDDVFAAITAKAGRTFWLNPEPRLYWNYGDSVISAYEKHCTAFECWRTDQLEDFVKALTRPEVP